MRSRGRQSISSFCMMRILVEYGLVFFVGCAKACAMLEVTCDVFKCGGLGVSPIDLMMLYPSPLKKGADMCEAKLIANLKGLLVNTSKDASSELAS
eukprot:10583908-Ditylum_brightwellii.AAC.1